MSVDLNSQRLVLRLDSATGLARVGWASDLPMGRFIHVKLIAESPQCDPITPASPLFDEFNRACAQARHINQPIIDEQIRALLSQGCLPVPLDLNDPQAATAADEFGSYRESAMRAFFRLTANFAGVWAVIREQNIVQLQSRRPPGEMEELQYQVWKQAIMKQLSGYGGKISPGKLVVQESGLWFCPEPF